MSKKKFELLIIDDASKSTIDTEDQLAYSILSNAKISPGGSYGASKGELRIADTKIKFSKLSADGTQGVVGKAFLMTSEGKYAEIKKVRELLLSHIKAQGFGQLYILKDEVSEQIACDLYPKIYKVENSLRGYLIKFMSTRIGPKWWEATAAGEWRKKVSERRNNETIFSKYVDSSAYLIDFGDLGKIVYAQSSGFNSKEDVLKKISECEETPEAIKKLKEELKSNYKKFFKEHFNDNGFQEKWEKLQWYRNKVAHNNLFIQKDADEAGELAVKLIEIIENAAKEMPHITIDESEREAIRESIVEKGYAFDQISEEVFMAELAKAEQFFNEPGKYVGLSHFVKGHLGPHGYDYAASYDLAEKLERLNKVELYKAKHPVEDYEVTAIRALPDTSTEA